MSSRLIVNTPYYSARQYVGGAGIGIFLDDAATDGVPGRRPPPMKPPIEEGMINVFEQADEETVNNWKRMLGKILVEQIVRPDVKRQWDRFTGNPDSAALHDFPRHYVLWVHKTGKTYDLRVDAYLYGSKHVHQFRSPAEFALHVVWLMKGSPYKKNGNPDCQCTYCSERPQANISKELGVRSLDTHVERGGGQRIRRPRSPPIVFKDYTKLNQGSTHQS